MINQVRERFSPTNARGNACFVASSDCSKSFAMESMFCLGGALELTQLWLLRIWTQFTGAVGSPPWRGCETCQVGHDGKNQWKSRFFGRITGTLPSFTGLQCLPKASNEEINSWSYATTVAANHCCHKGRWGRQVRLTNRTATPTTSLQLLGMIRLSFTAYEN